MKEFLTLLFRHQVATTMFHWITRHYAAHRAVGNYLEKLTQLQDTLIESWQGIDGRFVPPLAIPIGQVPIPQNPQEMQQELYQWMICLEHVRRSRVGDFLDQPLTDWITNVSQLIYLLDTN